VFVDDERRKKGKGKVRTAQGGDEDEQSEMATGRGFD
jgi:hypothetical protein